MSVLESEEMRSVKILAFSPFRTSQKIAGLTDAPLTPPCGERLSSSNQVIEGTEGNLKIKEANKMFAKKGFAALLVGLFLLTFLLTVEVVAEEPKPHIAISGGDFLEIEKGESHVLLEQPIVMVRSLNNQMWLFDFTPKHMRGGKFLSVRVDRERVGSQGRFVALNWDYVIQEKYLSWQQIKLLLKLKKRERIDTIKAIEKYLRREKLL